MRKYWCWFSGFIFFPHCPSSSVRKICSLKVTNLFAEWNLRNAFLASADLLREGGGGFSNEQSYKKWTTLCTLPWHCYELRSLVFSLVFPSWRWVGSGELQRHGRRRFHISWRKAYISTRAQYSKTTAAQLQKVRSVTWTTLVLSGWRFWGGMTCVAFDFGEFLPFDVSSRLPVK